MNDKQKKNLYDAAAKPAKFIKDTLSETNEEGRNVRKTVDNAEIIKTSAGNAADKSRIRYERKHHKGEKSDKKIDLKKKDIRSRGSVKTYAGRRFLDEMSDEEDFGRMYSPVSGAASAYGHIGRTGKAIAKKAGYKVLGPRVMTAPQRTRQRAIRKAKKIVSVPFRQLGKGIGHVGNKIADSTLGRTLLNSSIYRKTVISANAAKEKGKKAASFAADVISAPVRGAGAGIDLAKAKIIKPAAIVISAIVILQLILVSAFGSSGSSGSITFLIMDTKEHFNSFQNAFDNDEAAFKQSIDERAKGYADTLNDNGERIKYKNVTITYDCVTTNNIDDLLTVMTVLMDQSQEENHEEALSLFNELYFNSHSFNVVESPLYYCSGCVRHTETDEDGNRISWYECYGHVDAEINVHVKPFDELMLTYGFDEEQTDWAYALRNADDFSKLYGIKSMAESIAGESGFYIDDIKVNASSKKIPDNGSSMKIVYFTQGSGAEWANVPFGGGTIASSGCSVTSLAMVLSYLKGGNDSSQWIYPNEIVAAIAEKYGNYNRFYVAPYGQDGHGLFPAMASYYGVNCQEISSSSIINALKDGCPVIMSCVPGEFTKQGHFIVLTGLSDDGYILVNDPNGSHADKSYKKYTLNEIQNNGKGWWMFWN